MQKDNTGRPVGVTMEFNVQMKERSVALVAKELQKTTDGMDPRERALYEVSALHSIYEHAHSVGYRKGRMDAILNISNIKEV